MQIQHTALLSTTAPHRLTPASRARNSGLRISKPTGLLFRAGSIFWFKHHSDRTFRRNLYQYLPTPSLQSILSQQNPNFKIPKMCDNNWFIMVGHFIVHQPLEDGRSANYRNVLYIKYASDNEQYKFTSLWSSLQVSLRNSQQSFVSPSMAEDCRTSPSKIFDAHWTKRFITFDVQYLQKLERSRSITYHSLI